MLYALSVQRSGRFRMVFSISIRRCVDKAIGQAKGYMRMATLSDKVGGKKSFYDGNGGDGLNTAVHFLVLRYGGDAIIVAFFALQPFLAHGHQGV